MLLCSIFFLLLSNSLIFRRDISIYYSRIGIVIQLYCIFFCYNNLFLLNLDQSIGLFGGLFNISWILLVFHILIFLLTLHILIFPAFFYEKYFLKISYLIEPLNFLFLKLDKNSSIFTLMNFFIIILSIFTLFLFIILMIILSPFVFYLIQYNIIDDSTYIDYKIPMVYSYQELPTSASNQEIPRSDFSNIPNLLEHTGGPLTMDVLERMVVNSNADLKEMWSACLTDMNSLNNIYSEYINSVDYNPIKDTYNFNFRSKPNMSAFKYMVQKEEIFRLGKSVESKVHMIKTYYLPKLKSAEAQCYRGGLPNSVYTPHTPFQYARFYLILNQYNNQYWFLSPNLRTQNYNWR